MKKKSIATIKQLKDAGLVKIASEIPPPKKIVSRGTVDLHMEANLSIMKQTWTKDIEDYCFLHDIEPWDLIKAHQALMLHQPKKTIGSKKVEVQDLTAERAVGKHYDPMKNQLFKTKMGIK